MLKPRNLFDPIWQHLPDKRFTIITGARQVGKTSLLRMLLRRLQDENQTVHYLTLEDTFVRKSIDEHPDKVFDHLPQRPQLFLKGASAAPFYLLIDEVQYAADPTHFLKFLYDRYEGNLKVVATGSSAFYIDRKFTDSLAGRKRIFQLWTLTFAETLAFLDREDLLAEIKLKQERPEYQSPHWGEIQQRFMEYLTFGGYPAVALEPNPNEKKFLLDELKNAYIKRDLLEAGVEKPNKFYLLFQLLADQVGSLTNRHELSKTTQLDAKTVDNYLYILEKCFHISQVRPFYRNIQKELTKMPKIYLNDLGLRNALLNRFDNPANRADKGQLLENFFFCQFRDQFGPEQVRFWRTTAQDELDFVVEQSFGNGRAFEVKWNPLNFKPGSYAKFTDTYPNFPVRCLGAEDFHQFETVETGEK
ncbi:MAG: ATP-binding protein [Lewinellaceae bacterium]|nr:ATP-binding protein [Saprospiraceae bacterium]MCB9337876.1 ATP-binding protein [Lewinellaceae bacterium]